MEFHERAFGADGVRVVVFRGPNPRPVLSRREPMATGTRKAGDFCWINMLTPRAAEAMGFFGRVLGWTYFEMPGLGHGMRVGGRDIGGLFDLEGPNPPP